MILDFGSVKSFFIQFSIHLIYLSGYFTFTGVINVLG